MLYESASIEVQDTVHDFDLTPKLVAQELGKPLRMVQKLLLKGAIKGRKIRSSRGIEWRVSRVDLDNYIEMVRDTEIDSRLVEEMLKQLHTLEVTIETSGDELNKAMALQNELSSAMKAQARIGATLDEQIRAKAASREEKWWSRLSQIVEVFPQILLCKSNRDQQKIKNSNL